MGTIPITGHTGLTCLLGQPVAHSVSPEMHNESFRYHGLDYVYLAFDVAPEQFEAAVDGLITFNARGWNCTMPHKRRMFERVDKLSKEAELIGAVNTVIQKEGKLFGENTDGKGFVTALKNSGETLDKKNVTILGAGGAARAIAVECALNGAAHINIINRSIEKGEELASLIQMKTDSSAKYLNWKNNMAIPSDTDILINATSIGFSPNVTDKPDIDYTSITPEMCVCDVIFNPAETIFLKSAAENGAKTITGLGMLVQQAALNFTLWTGVEAPVDVMEDALKKEFE